MSSYDAVINCPYCNAPIADEVLQHGGFVSPCCNRVVACHLSANPTVGLYPAGGAYMASNGLTGDNSPVPGMPKLNSPRPQSKWTMVYTSGFLWYVRITPPINLEKVGFPHGLALATQFTSPFRAHEFADNVDKLFDVLEQTILGKGDA